MVGSITLRVVLAYLHACLLKLVLVCVCVWLWKFVELNERVGLDELWELNELTIRVLLRYLRLLVLNRAKACLDGGFHSYYHRGISPMRHC